jgi:hypothetical protein
MKSLTRMRIHWCMDDYQIVLKFNASADTARRTPLMTTKKYVLVVNDLVRLLGLHVL